MTSICTLFVFLLSNISTLTAPKSAERDRCIAGRALGTRGFVKLRRGHCEDKMACEERGRGPAPLKLVVFGGTGLTGKEVVKQALEKGYSVTSVVRPPEKAEIRYDAHFQGCTHPIISVRAARYGCSWRSSFYFYVSQCPVQTVVRAEFKVALKKITCKIRVIGWTLGANCVLNVSHRTWSRINFSGRDHWQVWRRNWCWAYDGKIFFPDFSCTMGVCRPYIYGCYAPDMRVQMLV